MARIIITMDDKVLQETPLFKEHITIGRRPHNDIVIDDPAVSAEHAVVVTILKDSFLEDLNSTNGTRVNGQPINKHFLQDNDVVELAKYKIRYVADAESASGIVTMPGILSPAAGPNLPTDTDLRETGSGLTATTVFQANASIKVRNGTRAGNEISLNKALTTIGRPGVQVAVITHLSGGYCITHVEGDAYPLVNGESIGTGAHSLKHGDVINLSGTEMEFGVI